MVKKKKGITKERTFAFLTTDSFRIESKGKSIKQAYYKAKNIAKNNNKKIIPVYTTFGRSGIDTGWKGWKGGEKMK